MAATGYSTIEEGSKAGVLDFIDRSANRGVMPPRRISARATRRALGVRQPVMASDLHDNSMIRAAERSSYEGANR
ncbi:hypothetical protein X769_10910 [Mesorhizobium sp. LSJC268A00]|nr:hypothetical protein X771_30265 [Mesorhizobium sp. LSJC277A00]ESW68720.1 hypothetical protein X773_28880 [Mesorhizobium sp. LSJC285A00]ESW93882.1 hypothetical protein X770_04030 [Mesorhizobium sp. LSJC269B00]ESX07312.1 hypothetical protein X769_10910 [Mesorhizobium sp. LSJC268A00]ESX53149.1 hypothetical protein X761_21890 [Mesorhizobium sp. LSHC424B00]ESX67197.1 hypothetical protein X758_25075 [Mesorhizobium sp. LSHC416B00]ESX94539.1 hypothetical protein X754_17250 [Mesorhizobium sp. LNJC4